MNIAKKLLFGLLLAGSLFTVACNDDGDGATKKEDGTACTKSDECKEGSKCAVDGSEAKCTKACNGSTDTTTCGTDGTMECGSKEEKGAANAGTKVNVCVAKMQTKKGVGQTCAANDECASTFCDNTSSQCLTPCDTDGDNNATCSAADSNKPNCKPHTKKGETTPGLACQA